LVAVVVELTLLVRVRTVVLVVVVTLTPEAVALERLVKVTPVAVVTVLDR
jgi:hypothetical protein